MPCNDDDLVERLSKLPADDLRSVLGFLGAADHDRAPKAEPTSPLAQTESPDMDP